MLALMVLFFAVSIQYTLKVSRSRNGTASAINRWANQLLDMDSGVNIHEKHTYPNPPIMALMLMPFAKLAGYSPVAGALTWFYLKVGMALLCMRWVIRLIETPELPFPVWAKYLGVALSIRPILGDLTHGNVNIFILFLVVSSLLAFSRGKDFLAGLLLALSIACKVTPALFVGYFLWKGAWRTLLGTAVGLVLFFLIVPAAFLGWEQNWNSLNSWIDNMIRPFLVGGVVTSEHNNQSLPGLIARLLTAAPSFSSYINNQYIALRYCNFTDIGSGNAKWLVKGFMVLFVVLVVWRCRAPIHVRGVPDADTRRGWRLAAEFALITLGMLLFNERTWKHHCVTLILPFMVLCYGLAALPWSRPKRRFIIGMLTAATLLMSSTSTGFLDDNPRTEDVVEPAAMVFGPAPVLATTMNGALTHSPGKIAEVYGAYIWAFFCLIGALGVVGSGEWGVGSKKANDESKATSRRAA